MWAVHIVETILFILAIPISLLLAWNIVVLLVSGFWFGDI
jgi:hypothetical protein